MEHTILVASATERGSTGEVAAAIAERPAARGVEVQQRPAGGARGPNAVRARAGDVVDVLSGATR
jgi:menaquinone-dependent protoporphyrinogen IX oxidase